MNSPRFVKAKLNNGIAILLDDEGEEFLIEMRRGYAWPIVSRKARRFELLDGKTRREQAKPKYEPFTLVKK
jgi:ParB-like chromosome segregation protein Spo0J